MMTVRPVAEDEKEQWLDLRVQLWPEERRVHRREIERYFNGHLRDEVAVLVAVDGVDMVGFVELSVRPFAEGCKSENVGYVEGWYVDEPARGRGIGRALIAAAEAWARSQGCTELASDADVSNLKGDYAHRACGFDEVVAIRCYRKVL